jgi:hypothetical protein
MTVDPASWIVITGAWNAFSRLAITHYTNRRMKLNVLSLAMIVGLWCTNNLAMALAPNLRRVTTIDEGKDATMFLFMFIFPQDTRSPPDTHSHRFMSQNHEANIPPFFPYTARTNSTKIDIVATKPGQSQRKPLLPRAAMEAAVGGGTGIGWIGAAVGLTMSSALVGRCAVGG